jgi:hypothetical protein
MAMHCCCYEVKLPNLLPLNAQIWESSRIKLPNLKLKTQTKQLVGSLLLDIALADLAESVYQE